MRLVRLVVVAAALAACDRPTSEPPVIPPSSLDAQLRATLQNWGAVQIGPVPAQSPAMVSLGQSLFFDKILSGNRDVSCGTCHIQPEGTPVDGLTLAIGTGATGEGTARSLGSGRHFVPRNAPSLLNEGLGFFYVLWDGRINQEGGPNGFNGPTGISLPSGLNNIVAAQAMLPILNRVEMRGDVGDVAVDGQVNELAAIDDANASAIWKAAMQRVLAVQAYVAKFNAAYPGVPVSALGFQHAANAIAAFQIATFTRTNSPFDRYLARDDRALTDEEKRGALLFFGKARCSTCHSGALLGGQQFANVGAPQVGPGVGAAAPLDAGRGEQLPGVPFYQFSFRVPPLRNVELTAPYMHSGAYRTLDAVVRHYTNADSAQRNYDVSQLDPAARPLHHGDDATITKVLANLAFQLRDNGIKLSDVERAEIVAFLKSLTDPAARSLAAAIPASVPSGLPVR